MEKWEYLKFEIRRGEIIRVNNQDPRILENWELFGFTFPVFKEEKIMELDFLKAIGMDGWEIIGIASTDMGTQVMLAKRPVKI